MRTVVEKENTRVNSLGESERHKRVAIASTRHKAKQTDIRYAADRRTLMTASAATRRFDSSAYNSLVKSENISFSEFHSSWSPLATCGALGSE